MLQSIDDVAAVVIVVPGAIKESIPPPVAVLVDLGHYPAYPVRVYPDDKVVLILEVILEGRRRHSAVGGNIADSYLVDALGLGKLQKRFGKYILCGLSFH